MPKPIFETGFGWVALAFVVALAAVIGIARWARQRHDATGQPFHTVYAGLGLLVGLPFVAFLLAGAPLTFEHAEMGRFKLQGGLVLLPELVALTLALSIYTAAFIAEIVRAGILSVSHGQIEAAHALGLKHGHTLRLVVLPQALRVIIPPLTSQYLNLTKNSSLAVAIGYPDFVNVFTGIVLNQTGQAVEVIAMTMGVYLTLSLLTSAFMNWYNRRQGAGGALSDGRGHAEAVARRRTEAGAAGQRGGRGRLAEANLFSTWYNTLLTLLCLWLLWQVVPPLIQWASARCRLYRHQPRMLHVRRRLLGVHQGALLAVHVRLLSRSTSAGASISRSSS